jgi:ATP-dependent RNA circularization protein (DNA/RNA ligase family)
LEYPKIETLFDRDQKTFKVLENRIRLPEFSNVKNWFVTEKMDGTNMRITYRTIFTDPHYRTVEIRGRTDNAQIPSFLLDYLQKVFTVKRFQNAFPDLKEGDVVTLFGEGYGAMIQKGGNYRKEGVSFRLFDVQVNDWWLEPENMDDVAKKMGIETVATIGILTLEDAVRFIKSKPKSIVAQNEGGNPEYLMEGIVARSYPLMLRRNGERVIWKLKWKDF